MSRPLIRSGTASSAAAVAGSCRNASHWASPGKQTSKTTPLRCSIQDHSTAPWEMADSISDVLYASFHRDAAWNSPWNTSIDHHSAMDAMICPISGLMDVRARQNGAPKAREVAQQHHVADHARLGQVHAVARGAGGPRDARSGRVADEDRRYRQVQLVGQSAGQELRVHGDAALDHQPAHPTGGQVGQDDLQVERVTGPDDLG